MDRRLAGQPDRQAPVCDCRPRAQRARPSPLSPSQKPPPCRPCTDRIATGSTVYADEAAALGRVPRSLMKPSASITSEAYTRRLKACTNQAESFFSRLRRAEIGTHHHIAGPYLAAYAAEMDWREDNRRVSNGEQYRAIVTRRRAAPVSAVSGRAIGSAALPRRLSGLCQLVPTAFQ